MNITVLAGGLSMERDVSLSSGAEICKALRKCGHNAVLVDLFLGVPDFTTIENFFCPESFSMNDFIISEDVPDIRTLRENRIPSDDGIFGKNVLTVCKGADVVFMALHGAEGENGKVQAAFDLLGITYTGTGYEGSLLAMDKALSKEIMRAGGVLTPDWASIQRDGDWKDKIPAFLPAVIKPVAEGSSVGVSIVKDQRDMEKALLEAFTYGSQVIVEKYIEGREFSVGILNGKVLPPIEIAAEGAFFDYKSKYQAGAAVETCPADITEQESDMLRQLAQKVHGLLRLGNYSRIDFMQDKKGLFYCLEANTLPGMTPNSLLPKEARAAGMSYEEVCTAVVENASNNA